MSEVLELEATYSGYSTYGGREKPSADGSFQGFEPMTPEETARLEAEIASRAGKVGFVAYVKDGEPTQYGYELNIKTDGFATYEEAVLAAQAVGLSSLIHPDDLPK